MMTGTVQARRWAVGLAIVLHGAIVVMMGLVSFGLVMIAAVSLASVPATAGDGNGEAGVPGRRHDLAAPG